MMMLNSSRVAIRRMVFRHPRSRKTKRRMIRRADLRWARELASLAKRTRRRR